MELKLKVLAGTNSGREIRVSTANFVIGRGDECHLRPKSDAVSRRHCAIVVADNVVRVQDFGSKNGTFVNDEPVQGDVEVKAGDELRVGPLRFGIVIEQGLGSAKRPVVKDVREVAARTAESKVDDLDITSWLEDDDDTAVIRNVSDPETRQFRLDETDHVALDTSHGEPADGEGKESEAADEKAEDDKSKEGKGSRWKKPEPGKLPKRPNITATDSREAAADMLRKFFNRR